MGKPDKSRIKARQSCTSISQPEPLRVVVIGGGPAGLATAIGFAHAGHRATVIEKRASPGTLGTLDRDRSYPVDITPRGMAALASLGIDKTVLANHGHLHVFKGHAEMCGETGKILRRMPMTGGEGLLGTRDDIVLAFERYAAQQHRGAVEVKHETTVVEFDCSRMTITLSDGFSLPYDLIVAADGKNSPTRAFFEQGDPQLLVTPRKGRVGETRYKTFTLDRSEELDKVTREGWCVAPFFFFAHAFHVRLYMVGGPPPGNPIFARTPLVLDASKGPKPLKGGALAVHCHRAVGIVPVRPPRPPGRKLSSTIFPSVRRSMTRRAASFP